MAIPPVTGTPGSGGYLPFDWGPSFRMLAIQFWAAIGKQNLALAEAIFAKIMELVAEYNAHARLAATLARMEAALDGLALLLAELAEAAPVAAAEAGGTFVLGEGGIIMMLVIFSLYALRGMARPASAEDRYGSGTMGDAPPHWPIRAQPHPVYTEHEWRRVTERQGGWRELIVGPPPMQASMIENRLAARVFLGYARSAQRRP